MDDNKSSEFRNRLLTDESFRAAFAEAPREALKTIGIEIPEGVEIPAMDKDELDQRVANITANISGDALEGLLAGGELSDAQLEHAAGGMYTASVASSIDY